MKRSLFFVFILSVDYALAQQSAYPLQLTNGLKIIFPAQPVAKPLGGFSESYVAETPQGVFTVLVRNQSDLHDSLTSINIDTLIDSYMNELVDDSNLGDISTTERITIGKLKGIYYRMKWEQSDNEPSLIIMTMTLISKRPWATYTISYQYFDTGEKALYNKESFIATVRE